MGSVVEMKKGKKKELPPEGSEAEHAIVSDLYGRLFRVTAGHHDVVICKAVAVLMGTLMTHTKEPGMVIGGFMKHIEAVANLAIAHHKQMEKENDKEADKATDGQPGPSDADTPESGDRNLQGEGQDVLLPPTLQ